MDGKNFLVLEIGLLICDAHGLKVILRPACERANVRRGHADPHLLQSSSCKNRLCTKNSA